MVLDGSLQDVQCAQYAAILQIFLLFSKTWYCRVQSPAVSKRQDVRWCSFRWSITLSIDLHYHVMIGLSRRFHAYNAYEIDAAKLSSPHSAEFPIVCMIIFSWIQSPAVSKQQDVRWCSFHWSIPLSIDYVWKSNMDSVIRLLHAHIAYEIYTAKIIAAFRRISYCLYDWIRMNSIACLVQSTKCTMM